MFVERFECPSSLYRAESGLGTFFMMIRWGEEEDWSGLVFYLSSGLLLSNMHLDKALCLRNLKPLPRWFFSCCFLDFFLLSELVSSGFSRTEEEEMGCAAELVEASIPRGDCRSSSCPCRSSSEEARPLLLSGTTRSSLKASSMPAICEFVSFECQAPI